MLVGKQFAQEFRTLENGHAFGTGSLHLDIVLTHRGRADHPRSAVHVARGMTDVHRDADLAERLRQRRIHAVRAGHVFTALNQDAGDGREPGATNANEVRGMPRVHITTITTSVKATATAK